MKLIWFLIIGWWYLPIKWAFKFIFSNNSTPTIIKDLRFEVRTWDDFAENIKMWQSQNARHQWIGANYTNKPIYQYSWKSNIPINFVAEPTNEYDDKAIAVYLDGLHIGYVPREINIKYHDFILNTGTALADIHGGNRKRLDEYGDVIVEKFNPIVDVEILNLMK